MQDLRVYFMTVSLVLNSPDVELMAEKEFVVFPLVDVSQHQLLNDKT